MSENPTESSLKESTGGQWAGLNFPENILRTFPKEQWENLSWLAELAWK